MMKTLRNLIGMAAREDATTGELAPTLPAAEAELAAAHEAAAAAGEAYKASVLVADDSTLRKLKDACTDAAIRIDRAEELVRVLRERLADAQAREEEARRIEVYQAAKRQAAEVHDAFREMYPRIVESMADLLRALAEAEEATKAANKELPDGMPALHGVETSMRAQPAVLPQLLSEETVQIWCRIGDGRGDLIDQSRVEIHHGKGLLRNKTGPVEYLVIRSFLKRTMSGMVHGYIPDTLAKAVKLPDLVVVASKAAPTVEYKLIGKVDVEADRREAASLTDKLARLV